MNRLNQQTFILAAGDWLAVGLFVFLGQRNHDIEGQSLLLRFLITAALLALPFTAVSLLLGAYQLRDNFRGFIGRSLTAWLVAVPFGLTARAFYNDQTTIVISFMLVTMFLGGAFLLAWRTLFWRFLAKRP